MSTTMNTSHDQAIQTAVQDELQWTPDVDAAGIGVAVEDSGVTLSGEVDDYSELLAAKRAALRVQGVSTIVDNLKVRPNALDRIDETEIAREVSLALTSATNVPSTVKAQVDGGQVILSGEVDWQFQREAAKRAVQYLRGVESVDSRITLTARLSADDAAERIKNALIRNAQLDAHHITVTVLDNNATLTGYVHSWAAKKQAGTAAWSSPHVTEVDNHLEVRPY
jgi:VCBS repeat-containing protein